MRINQNLAALTSYNANAATNGALQKSIRNLSTGLRVNSAADDAAGLAISEKMRAQIRGLDQAARNAQDGISMIQTAEGALNETHSILQRMRELSVQAANDTLTANDRAYVQLEIDQLKEEIDRISDTTQFNRKTLLNGNSDVLWSSDILSTRAIVRGPIEREGNYNISIDVLDAGQGEIQKTNILRQKKELYIDDFVHDVTTEIVEKEVPVGELDDSETSLGFPWLSYSISGDATTNSVVGKVTIKVGGATVVDLDLNDSQPDAAKALQDAIDASSELVRTTNGFYSVAAPQTNWYDREPGGTIEMDWNLTVGSIRAYPGYPDSPNSSSVVSGASATISVDGSGFDVEKISWDAGKENNLLEGDYYVDICPAKAMAAAVGTIHQAKNPFLVTANTLRYTATRDVNMSIVFEVTDMHDHEGFNSVAFSYYYVQINSNGVAEPPKSGTFVVDLNNPDSGLTGVDFDGVVFTNLPISRDISEYTVGDKFSVTTSAQPRNQVAIAHKGQQGAGGVNYFANYSFNSNVLNGTPIDMPFYQISDGGEIVLSNVGIGVKYPISHYHNHSNGVSRDAPYAAKFTVNPTGDTRALEFQQTRISCTLDRKYQNVFFDAIADEKTRLRELNQFYDANGRFLLEDPQTIKISQGGRLQSVTLYADDTVSEMVKKLNGVLQQSRNNIEGAATFTEPGGLDTLASAFERLGAMRVDDTFVQNLIGGSLQEASALKLMNGQITRDALRGLRGSDAVYLEAFAIMMDNPSASDADVISMTGVSAAEQTRLRAILGKNGGYSADDISFITGLSAAEIQGVSRSWDARNSAGRGQNVANVPGTIVIRSTLTGIDGRVGLSGDEEILKALGLNVIQEARETVYSATVTDAHSGETIASGRSFSGNKMVGVIDDNVDVVFDPMAGMDVVWNEKLMKHVFEAKAGGYRTVLHLVDNATILQIGANEKEEMEISFGDVSSRALGMENLDVTSSGKAGRSLTLIDSAISKVSKIRAKLGAYQNRLEHTTSNLTTAGTNMSKSESLIRDADMAREMMNFTRLNILSQAGSAMMAQSNQLPQNVLTLLR